MNSRKISSEKLNAANSSTSLEKIKKPFWLLGDTVTFKLTGQETAGKYSVWEIKVPSQSGPPSHYHLNLEEGFHILEGEFSFQYNGKVVNANANSFIHVQRQIVHTYKNIGNGMGRLLVIGLPAGFENFIEELGVPIVDEKSFIPPAGSTPRDIRRIIEISKKHGIIFVPALKNESNSR